MMRLRIGKKERSDLWSAIGMGLGMLKDLIGQAQHSLTLERESRYTGRTHCLDFASMMWQRQTLGAMSAPIVLLPAQFPTT